MSEKRMLIVDAELVRKIDENRGDMDRTDFISFLISSCLQEAPEMPDYITKEEFNQYQQGTRELLRNFLEFFISYGLEMGKQPEDKTFQELTQKLQNLGRKSKNL